MQKRKKQLLGLCGLAIVGVVTAVALSLPASAYDADGDGSDETDGSSVTVTVNVAENGASVRITSPKHNEVVTESQIPLTLVTSHVTSVQPILTYKAANGQMVEKNLDVIYPEGQATVTRMITLPQGDTEYTLKVVATGTNGTVVEDSITFSYRAMSVTTKGEVAENDDPIIYIAANGSVYRFQIQAYAQDGTAKPVFVNAEGEQEALVFGRDALDENGKMSVTLPFAKYKAQAGTYDVAVVAYDEAGNVISMNRVEVKYSPKTPDVPGTGSMLLDNLNISRMDYLLTGLIAFGAVAGFAVYLVFRKSRR